MSDKGLNLIVSEYHIIWEAMKHYEKYLDNMSLSAPNEDEELKYDEKLQDIENVQQSLKVYGKRDYDINFSD